MVVARSSSDGVVLCYVLPVLRTTSRLAVMGGTPARVGSTQRQRSITCATAVESDVYECLLKLKVCDASYTSCKTHRNVNQLGVLEVDVIN